MLKKTLCFLLTAFSFVFILGTKPVLASDKFFTVSNPVNGYEGWETLGQSPLDMPKFLYQESTHSAFPVTWLLRYDALSDATISAYFEKLTAEDNRQYLGGYFEVTPWLARDAGVVYPDGLTIHSANRVFLSGYAQKDRLALIDTYMEAFFKRYGYYPRSVAAWHIDSYSLQYLQTKYSVLTAMNCDEQYAMDNYRLWGGYTGSPYFPDKNNSLLPASSSQNRINLAMVRWAQRDLFNFYGNKMASLFSVQLNDYLSIGQTTNYFEKIVSLYAESQFNEVSYLNIGLENSYYLNDYRQEIINMYRAMTKARDQFGFKAVSLSQFGDWFKISYPESSPVYFYRTGDLTQKKEGEVFWYESPYYRLGIKATPEKTEIIDLRVYNREIYEDHFATPNQDLNLYVETPAVVDTVKDPASGLVLDLNLSDFVLQYDKQWDNWQVTLVKDNQKVIFYPKAISFVGITPPLLNSADITVTSGKQDTTWTVSPHTPYKTRGGFWIIAGTILAVICFYLFRQKTPLLFGFFFVLIAGFTVFKSGLLYPFGLGFFGPNGHDAIFHLSLIEKFSAEPANLEHPQYAGSLLSNYHFIFDYLSGLISRVFGLLPLDLYFRFTPLLFGFSLVFLLNRLLDRWQYGTREKILSYFLVFLSGSLGFIPKLINGQGLFSGESSFWSNQSVSIFLNPPFALSVIFVLLFLINLPQEGKMKPSLLFKLALLGGLLSQTKVYAFLLLLGGLFVGRYFLLTFAVGLVGALITLPFSTFSGIPFLFEPLWFTRSLFASPDRFFWPRLVEAWQAYEATGSFFKLTLVNLFALFVFLLGNLGVRVFGLLQAIKEKKTDPSQKVAVAIIFIGLFTPLLFIQKVNPWNSIQFMYYSLFFLGIFSARYLVRFFGSLTSPLAKFILPVTILFLSSLTTIGTLKDYFGSFSSSRVSYTELRALDELKKQPRGIVLSPVYQKINWIANPKPLHSYVSTAYISAFSAQPEFLSDTINLDITGYDYKERLREVQRFYHTSDKVWAKQFLQENNIRYVYETYLQKMRVSPGDLGLLKIFDSGEINIYKIN